MTKQEFSQRYLEAVHKCALGIHVIRIKGPELGFDDETMDQNAMQLIEMLSEGVGVSFESVYDDVHDQVAHFDKRFFRRPEVRKVMGLMVGQMQSAGLLTAGG